MRAVVFALLLAAYILLSAQQISFATSANDLARHLRDGELTLTGRWDVLHKNLYSYTHPDAEFLNHHWLAAVLFSSVYNAAGPVALNLFYISLGGLAFFIFLRLAEREAGLSVSACLAALLLPLIAARAGIRPEIFSVVFVAVFLWVLLESARGRMGARWLWALPALEILWVNLHPGFILGPLLIGLFLLAQLFERRWPEGRRTAIVLAASLAAGLCNPNGVRGLLFPVTVVSDYAFPVGENRSVFYWQKLAQAVRVEAAAAGLILSAAAALHRRAKLEWPVFLFAAIAGAGALAFIRVYVFFAGAALVSLSAHVRAIRGSRSGLHGLAAAVCVVVALWNAGAALAEQWPNAGLGLKAGEDAPARFLQENRIRGRVFNSYGSGGYLIRFLPDLPVYIDSRPEAYPADFIRDEYLRALREESAWREVQSKYNFDVIFFLRLEETDGRFVLRRAQDPEWALVSIGDRGNILLRRRPQFAETIRLHEVRF